MDTYMESTMCKWGRGSSDTASPEARKEEWTTFSLRAPRKDQSRGHLDFRRLACKVVRECVSVALSHRVCGNSLQEPEQETIITPCHDIKALHDLASPAFLASSHTSHQSTLQLWCS